MEPLGSCRYCVAPRLQLVGQPACAVKLGTGGWSLRSGDGGGKLDREQSGACGSAKGSVLARLPLV